MAESKLETCDTCGSNDRQQKLCTNPNHCEMGDHWCGEKPTCYECPDSWHNHVGEPAQGESRPIVGTELDSGFIDYKPAAAVGEGISAEQFHAPNCDHVKDDLISRRRVYRMIERMAGMQVPVIDHDAFGDPFTRAAAKPAEIYAHVLKGIDQSPGGTASSQFMIEQAIEWSGKAGRLQGELDKMNREIGELRKERDALKRQLEQK